MTEIFQKMLKDRIEDKNISMFIIDSPTGSGKSYQIAKYIRENYQNKKIIFLANKHNQLLSDSDIIKDLSDEERTNIIKQILRLPSIKDTFLKEFKKEILPDDFYNENSKICKKIMTILKILENDSLEEDIKDEYSKNFYIKEKEFRCVLKEYIKRECKKKERKCKNYVQNEEWISKLYPTVFLKDRNIILMTVHKFFKTIDPIYEKSYKLPNVKFDENVVLFIDEFDETKKTLLDLIIDDNINNYKVECFRLFRKIHHEIDQWNIPKFFHLPKPVEGYKKVELTKAVQDEVRKLQDKYKKIYIDTEEILSLSFKSKDLKSKYNFIFNDNNVYTITNNSRKSQLVYHSGINEDDKTNIITEKIFDKNENINNTEKRLDYLYRKINNAISLFIRSVTLISQNYMDFYNANRNGSTEKITFTGACKSIISILNLGEENEIFLIEKMIQNIQNRNSSIYFQQMDSLENNEEKRLIEKFENDKRRHKYDFYKNGFSYMEVVDSIDDHNLDSRVYSYNYDIVPERLIINLCVNYKIIGLSATSTIHSILTNYDLGYFKQVLKDRISFCTQEERKLLMNNYNDYLGNAYDDRNIVVDFTIDEDYQAYNSNEIYLKKH